MINKLGFELNDSHRRNEMRQEIENMETFKPCPFCGVELTKSDYGRSGEMYHPMVDDGCLLEDQCFSYSDLKWFWNTRTDPVRDALVEALLTALPFVQDCELVGGYKEGATQKAEQKILEALKLAGAA